MDFERSLLTVVVSVAVALASFSGAAGAVAPTGQVDGTVQQQAMSTVQGTSAAAATQQEANTRVESLTVRNLSTSMQVEGITLEVRSTNETGATETETVTVDSATVELSNATVEVENATLEDGAINLESAAVRVTEGTVEIQSDEGDRTIDLSGTDESVEDGVVVLSDLGNETFGADVFGPDTTVSRLTVSSVGGSATIDSMAMNVRSDDPVVQPDISVAVVDGDLSVEGATVTLVNATLEDGVLRAEQVNGSVDAATLEAESLTVLVGSNLTSREDVSVTVEETSFNETDVEFQLSDLGTLLEDVLASQAAAETA